MTRLMADEIPTLHLLRFCFWLGLCIQDPYFRELREAEKDGIILEILPRL